MSDLVGLVYSRNPISSKTANGKTLAALLSWSPSENIYQVYTSDLEPDYSLCDHFKRISEANMVRNIVGLKSKRSISMGSQKYIPQKASISLKAEIIIKSLIPINIRNIIWKCNNGIGNSIAEWMNDIIPNYLLLMSGNLIEEFNVTRELVKKYNIPLIVVVGDDYYSKKNFETLYQRKLRNAFINTIRNADLVIAISEPMKALIQRYSDCKTIVAMNSANLDFTKGMKKLERHNPVTISYFGNVGLDRIHTIIAFGKIIDKWNLISSVKFIIKVFIPYQITTRMVKKLNNVDSIEYCGSVFGNEYIKAVNDADILLHVESFKRKYKRLLSTALSTKIPEYLCAKRLVVVIAPPYAESGNIIKRNKMGIVFDDLSRLEEGLSKLSSMIKTGDDSSTIQAAFEFFEKNLDREIKAKEIKITIEAICNGNEINRKI